MKISSRPLLLIPFLFLAKVTEATSPPSQEARLLAADGTEVCCAAISGQTIVALSGGVGHVFVEPEGGWVGDVFASATLRASEGARLISVTSSGHSVVLGGYLEWGDSGAAYVFAEPAAGWSGDLTEQAKLIASDAAPWSFFGFSVAIEGNVVVVSASDAEVEPGKHGAAYVFVKPPHGWSGVLHEQAKLRPLNPQRTSYEDGSFFHRVAISDGAIFAAANYEGAHHGSVYAFTKPALGWQGTIFETARLTASDSQREDHFGQSIAVWGDTLVVGSVGYERDAPAAAYVFVEPPGGWAGASQEQAMLIHSGGVSSEAVVVDRDIILAADLGFGVFGNLLAAFVEPAGGWAGRLTRPDVVFSVDHIASRVALRGDILIFGSRVFRLGLDADRDGLSDAMESKVGTDPLDEDSDRDSIADGSDPSWLAAEVESLSAHVLRQGGSRRALLGMLGSIEQRIAAGDLDGASRVLSRMSRHMDGCEPLPDRNDWILACETQRELQALVDILSENLGH